MGFLKMAIGSWERGGQETARGGRLVLAHRKGGPLRDRLGAAPGEAARE